MTRTERKLWKCLECIRKKTDFKPKIALVLGSGLGSYASEMEVEAVVHYSEIEGFPISTVSGHEGRFLFGYINRVPVVMMQGRVHYYEGYAIGDVVLPIRLMGLMGAEKLILTNAAGGIRADFTPGTLMMITDHISSFIPSPLIGANADSLGVRFPDMSQVYSLRLQEIAENAADKLGITLQKGVYIQMSGPNYETPAEIRMCRTLGADAVGMSTACEAMAARHMGMEICGISCITNLAAGVSNKTLDHREVEEIAVSVEKDFKAFLTEIIQNILNI